MHRFLGITAAAIALTFSLAGCGSAFGNHRQNQADGQQSPKLRTTMHPFSSDAELATYLRQLADRQKIRTLRSSLAMSLESNAPAPASKAAASADESITNVQHAGVDEGGIIKVHGNHLVILRRGRLFTVAIGDRTLAPVSAIDAFGPDVDPNGTWYDEMLVSKDTVVVIGYSYQRGGTEVGLFNIDASGRLSYRSTYQLRSNDYYSSRNYASRLIGDKLIFYTPLYLSPESADLFRDFPAVRKWHKDATARDFKRIVPATQVYRPVQPLDAYSYVALHTVTICDLAGGGFDCKATSVIGPPGRVFYVSPGSVYIWATDWAHTPKESSAQSTLYRMPLDGSGPSALKVSGSPVDQFSFLESDDGYLNVAVRSEAAGDEMWAAEGAAGSMALLRVPLQSFSDGTEAVPKTSYRKLPSVGAYGFQNRFVADYLLYGTGSGWGRPQARQTTLYAVRYDGGDVQALPLSHGVDRIEQIGSDAMVAGTDGEDLHLTAVRLGVSPVVADEYVRKGASQGELRSHGFFYKPETPDSGMLGLPIAVPGRAGYRHLFEGSAAILFVRNDSLHFQDAGELDAHADKAENDECRASCVDWYGNSQPVFVRGRILALLGYELVEGTVEGERIREIQRVSYAPKTMSALKR